MNYCAAFDFHETLWSEHAPQRRADLMQALYRALHAAGWRIIVLSWSASPPDDRPRDTKWRHDTFAALGLPPPDKFIICYEEGKTCYLKQEKVDLLIDDNMSWINDAQKHGIFTLALGGAEFQ